MKIIILFKKKKKIITFKINHQKIQSDAITNISNTYKRKGQNHCLKPKHIQGT